MKDDNYTPSHMGDDNNISSYTDVTKVQKNNVYKTDKHSFKHGMKDEKKRLKYISRKNRRFFKLFWVGMVVVLSVMTSQFLVGLAGDVLAMNRRTENTVSISIPKNSSRSDVANILQDAGVIKNAACFMGYTSLFRGSVTFDKGDYDIKTNLEYEEIISYLLNQTNRTDVADITFSEGLTIRECADLLEEKGICDKNEFLEKCNSSEFDEEYPFLAKLKNTGQYYYKLEGYLYPDTYKFYQGSDASTVISKMLSNFNDKMSEKNQSVSWTTEKLNLKQVAKEKGLSLEELITLASLVQAEAADVKDMDVIASIFLNRLNADVNEGLLYLNSDATVYYPYLSKKDAPEGFCSTYDTNKYQGLPAGAIRNPGMDAIEAVLYHDETSYKYFCHDSDGNAYYATTEYEHTNNLYKAGIL